MKTIFNAFLFLAATSSVACGGAPVGSEDPAANEAPAAAAAHESSAASTAPESAAASTGAGEAKLGTEKVNPDDVWGTCTPAQLRHCINTDPGGFGSGCETRNGVPICLYY
jgi:hypothetical protein